jgi:hypothetical protein
MPPSAGLLTEDEQRSYEQQLRAPLRRLGRQVRAYVLLDGLTRWAGLALLLLFGLGGLDYLLGLRLDMRAVGLAAVVAAVLVHGYWRVIRPAMRALPTDDLAVIVQRRFPQLGDRLVTAVQLAEAAAVDEQTCSPALARAAVRRGMTELKSVRPRAVLDHHHAGQRVGLVWALAAVVVGACLLWPDVFGIAFRRNILLAEVPWPQRTTLRLLEYSTVVARGEGMVVLAEALGVVPRQVFADRRIDERTERLQLRQIGDNRFRAFGCAAATQ